MSQPANIKDSATGVTAKVTSRGELVISKISYSTSYAGENSTATTSTIVTGKANKIFVITSLLVTQDKTNVDTHITIFEASDLNDTTENVIIMETDFARNQTLVATQLDIATQPTQWINLKTDTLAVINVTLAGYYIDA